MKASGCEQFLRALVISPTGMDLVGMIPRGKRLKKIPTTVSSNVFETEWNQILSTCSIKRMELIVIHESETLAELSTKLEEVDKTLQEFFFHDLPEYQEQFHKFEDTLNKQEESIMDIKKFKFQLDTYDYIYNQVYEWGRRMKPITTPKSILRKKKYWKQSKN